MAHWMLANLQGFSIIHPLLEHQLVDFPFFLRSFFLRDHERDSDGRMTGTRVTSVARLLTEAFCARFVHGHQESTSNYR